MKEDHLACCVIYSCLTKAFFSWVLQDNSNLTDTNVKKVAKKVVLPSISNEKKNEFLLFVGAIFIGLILLVPIAHILCCYTLLSH